MNKLLLLIVLVMAVLVVGCAEEATTSPQMVSEPAPLIAESEPAPETSPAGTPSSTPEARQETPAVEEPVSSEAAIPQVREFSITARNWEYDPGRIVVNKGDTVRFVITSVEGTHGFNLPAFGVNERLVPGQTISVEFVADKEGTFSFSCNIPCGKGHGGMAGELVVE